MREPDLKVLDIKKALASANIDDSNLVYMPEVPLVGSGLKEFIIEEEFGMKVARLVSPPND